MQVLLCDGMHGESTMTRLILQRATQIDTVGAVHSDHIEIIFVGKTNDNIFCYRIKRRPLFFQEVFKLC
jgi:hypothetical protein